MEDKSNGIKSSCWMGDETDGCSGDNGDNATGKVLVVLTGLHCWNCAAGGASVTVGCGVVERVTIDAGLNQLASFVGCFSFLISFSAQLASVLVRPVRLFLPSPSSCWM